MRPGPGRIRRLSPATVAGMLLQRSGVRGRSLVIAIPVLWLGLFFLVPFLVVARLSVSVPALARPPYLPLWHRDGETLTIVLNPDNYLRLLRDGLYQAAWLESVSMAAVSTLVALLVGYPVACLIAAAPPRRRNLLLLLVILPFWTSFLLRVYAWIGFLKGNGVISNILLATGIIDAPLVLLHTDLAVCAGIVYTYLPFMILPLYASLAKLDPACLDAAADLGARPMVAFRTITLPLSRNGMIAGAVLVFVPAVGEFVIPALLGGPDTLMIGAVLWNEFFANRDWPMAAAIAVTMLVMLVIPIAMLQGPPGDRVRPVTGDDL